MKIIDSHVHFWNYDSVRDAWMEGMPVLQQNFLPSALEPILKAYTVDGCVAVQAEKSEKETEFLLDLANSFPFIKAVVGWVDLRAANIEERLHNFSEQKIIKGWRHIVQAEPTGFLSDQQFLRGIAALSAYNYTYDILIYPKHLKEAGNFVAAFPEQKFVIDHAAKPSIAKRSLKEWADGIKTLAEHPQVYCKLSGLLTEAKIGEWREEDFYPYLDVLLETFGTGRLMFGSDWPVINVAGEYGQWINLLLRYMQQFNEEEIHQLFGENAIRFYAL